MSDFSATPYGIPESIAFTLRTWKAPDGKRVPFHEADISALFPVLVEHEHEYTTYRVEVSFWSRSVRISFVTETIAGDGYDVGDIFDRTYIRTLMKVPREGFHMQDYMVEIEAFLQTRIAHDLEVYEEHFPEGIDGVSDYETPSDYGLPDGDFAG